MQMRPEKKKRDQENKRKLIELDAPSEYHSCYQTLIIIIRQCVDRYRLREWNSSNCRFLFISQFVITVCICLAIILLRYVYFFASTCSMRSNWFAVSVFKFKSILF